MTDTAIINILKQRGIYITPTRVMVLSTLLSHMGAISSSEIGRLTPVKLDRVSVYRTLQLFLKKGLVALAPKTNGWPQYLVTDISNPGAYIEPGKITTFFMCRDCGTMRRLKIFSLPGNLVPPGYDAESCQVILKGRCDQCMANS